MEPLATLVDNALLELLGGSGDAPGFGVPGLVFSGHRGASQECPDVGEIALFWRLLQPTLERGFGGIPQRSARMCDMSSRPEFCALAEGDLAIRWSVRGEE